MVFSPSRTGSNGVAEFVDMEAALRLGREPDHVGFDGWVGEGAHEGRVVDHRRQLGYRSS